MFYPLNLTILDNDYLDNLDNKLKKNLKNLDLKG